MTEMTTARYRAIEKATGVVAPDGTSQSDFNEINAYKVDAAAAQLTRYSGHPFCSHLAEAVCILSEINDDFWHRRCGSFTTANTAKLRAMLDELDELAAALDWEWKNELEDEQEAQ